MSFENKFPEETETTLKMLDREIKKVPWFFLVLAGGSMLLASILWVRDVIRIFAK